MLSRVVVGRGDEKAVKSATAASTITNLCDVYTQNDLEDKWKELLTVYDVRLSRACYSREENSRNVTRSIALNDFFVAPNSNAAMTTI